MTSSTNPPLQYFSKATAEGPGRNGIVKSFGDSPLELKMAMPKAAGGKGDGQNPEQLFAMGYACEFTCRLIQACGRPLTYYDSLLPWRASARCCKGEQEGVGREHKGHRQCLSRPPIRA